MKKINQLDKNAISEAKEFLNKGKIISFNCDTVYGLAVDASNSEAVLDLYKLKERNKDKPIVIFVKNIEVAKKVFKFNAKSLEIAKEYFPSLTLILEKQENIPYKLANNLNEHDSFLGFRILDNEFTQNLFSQFDGILAVTSANPSNEKPAINADMVEDYFKDSNILLIDGGDSKEKIASSVIKIYNENVEILREGKTKIS